MHQMAKESAAAAVSSTIPHNALFVHPVDGSDANSGELGAPLRSIQVAVDRAASFTPTRAVVLRGGTHFIRETINYGPEHSNLHVLGYPGEKAVISGGVELKTMWKPFHISPSPPPSPTKWILQDNYNYVFDYKNGDPNFPMLGLLSNKVALASLARTDSLPVHDLIN